MFNMDLAKHLSRMDIRCIFKFGLTYSCGEISDFSVRENFFKARSTGEVSSKTVINNDLVCMKKGNQSTTMSGQA